MDLDSVSGFKLVTCTRFLILIQEKSRSRKNPGFFLVWIQPGFLDFFMSNYILLNPKISALIIRYPSKSSYIPAKITYSSHNRPKSLDIFRNPQISNIRLKNFKSLYIQLNPPITPYSLKIPIYLLKSPDVPLIPNILKLSIFFLTNKAVSHLTFKIPQCLL